MVNQIVFLVCWPITNWEAKRWGFDYLRNQGFSVQVFDVSRLIKGKALQLCPVIDALEDTNIHKFDNYSSLDEMVRKFAGSSIFIDYIMGLAPVDFWTEKIYRILGRNRARYCVISAGAIPEMFTSHIFGDVVRRFLYDLSLAANPLTLFNFLAKKIISVLTSHVRIYPTPDMIFGGKSDVLERYRTKYRMAPDKIIPIHSIDHDTFLDYCAQGGSVIKNNTCIFLDEAATHHSDFALLNIKPIEEKSYFVSMNRLFDKIEIETGLTLIIAAHPRSDYANMLHVFGGREIVKGKTVDLVARSSMVVTHASTAVSFAVLFEKPLLFVKTNGIVDNTRYSMLVDTMARSFGLNPLLIDTEEFAKLRIRCSDCFLDGYRDYLYKYIKSPSVDNLTLWEVVFREVCRYNDAQVTLND